MSIPIQKKKPRDPVRARLHEIIFEADTRIGRLFDLILIWSILLSVAAVMLDSVAAVRAQYGTELLTAVEWFFTVLFTLEYLLAPVVHRQAPWATPPASSAWWTCWPSCPPI